MVTTRGRVLLPAAIALGVAWSSGLSAQVFQERDDELARLAIGSRLVAPHAALSPIDPLAPQVAELADGVGGAWSGFLAAAPGRWRAEVDLRTGRIGFVEGEGMPWIPGAGNRLGLADVRAPLDPTGAVGLATLEALARDFAGRHATLLGIDPASLRLAPGRRYPRRDRFPAARAGPGPRRAAPHRLRLALQGAAAHRRAAGARDRSAVLAAGRDQLGQRAALA